MSVEPPPAFRHKPLKPNTIRLLRLKSRAHSPYLTCEIVHCSKENDHDYIALSYAWGPEGDNESILVDGCRCTISTHLTEALRHLQKEDEDCLYWIDQLCINQTDDEEKNDQVYGMKDIYEQAQHVVAWLGKSNDDSDLLLVFFQILAEQEGYAEYMAIVPILELVVQRLQDLFNRRDSILPWDEERVLARLSSAFDNFCNRNYWKRVWVIQEFALAKATMICCGRILIDFWPLQVAWDILRRAQDRLYLGENSVGHVVKRAFTAPTMSFVSGILTRRRRYQDLNTGEALFLVMYCNLCLECDYNQVQASDIRDRSFALMGLCSDMDDFKMFPDYSISAESVYEILARRFLEQGYIDNLAHCQFPHHLGNDALPTWVPDWSMHLRLPVTGYHSNVRASAARTQSKPITGPNPKVVTLEGVFIDTIADLGNEWDPNWLEDVDPDAALRYLTDIWRFRTRSPRLRETSTLFDCARLAIADRNRWRDEEFPHWLGVMWPDALTSLTRDDQLEAEFYNLRLAERYVALMKRLHSRRPFISKSGWVGLAPSCAKPDDKIVIFLGGKAAYVVRAKDASTYTVIGEAYVHGIMYGEFMTDDVQVELFNLV